MQEMRIRRAGPADAATITALLLTFNGEVPAFEVLAERMVALRSLEAVFQAERGPEPVGLLMFRIVPALSSPRD